MANTTFSGPVRSENGFDLINKNSVGEKITDIGLTVIEKSLTVANGATTGTTTDTLPTNFIAVSAVIVVTTASSNAVNIADLGVTGDTDGYLDQHLVLQVQNQSLHLSLVMCKSLLLLHRCVQFFPNEKQLLTRC